MKLVSLLKTLSYGSSHGVSVDGTSLANHKAKKSNNPLNNSGLCEYVISVCKTSPVHKNDNDFNNRQLLSQVQQNALLIFDYC